MPSTMLLSTYADHSNTLQGPAYIPFRQSGVTTSLLSIPDEHTHSKYRKLVSNAYSMSSIKGYEPYVYQMVARFVEVCDQHATNKESLDLSLWCHYCEIAPGSVFQCLTFG